MRNRWINLTIFLLFLFEGSIFQFINPSYHGSNVAIVPRFVLTAIILVSIFKDRKYAFALGIVFGLLYDVVYGDFIGLYTVGLAGIGYFSGWSTQFLHPTFLIYLFMQLLGFVAFESFLTGMLSLFKMINFQLEWEVIYVLIPSIIINLLFAALLYTFSEKIQQTASE